MSGSKRRDLVVLVCGGRKYANQAHVFVTLDDIHAKRRIVRVLHGDATGADSLGKAWAVSRGIPEHGFPVTREDWDRYGLGAGPRRNKRMAEARPDVVVAFPGNNGTASMRSIATAAGIPVYEPLEPT